MRFARFNRWYSGSLGLGCVTLSLRNVHIVGGGLAGLSLAIGLRNRGVGVVVSEAGHYPRHRVCGEFISGVADATLDRLGIQPAFQGALAPQSLRWASGGRLIFEGALPVAARAISRHLLDARLAKLFTDLGGTLRVGERVENACGEGKVFAAGRPKHARGSRIGLKVHIRGIRLQSELEMQAGSNGYAGLVEVEDGWVNACGIFRVNRQLRGRGPDLLFAYLEAGGNPALANLLRDAEFKDGSFSAVAGFDPGRQPGRVGELSIGDADQMIPPFTGNGMSMAFEAADAALDPLVAWAHGDLDWQDACSQIRASLARRFRKRMAAAKAIEPMLTRRTATNIISTLASANALPFQTALSLVR